MQRDLIQGNQNETAPASRDQENLVYLVHDMRSAASSIGLMVDLLELAAKAEDDTIQRARAISAQKSCNQLALLCAEAVTHLAGTDDKRSAPEKFDLLELLVEVVAVYSPIFDLSGKSLRLDSFRRAPQFFGNRSRLFRAISNLLDNGLKHTSNGATVVIACSDNIKDFAISVSDDGPGFADSGQNEIRSIESLPVVSAHISNTSAVFAPGTGLRFVAETVAQHDGSSRVEPNRRGGTTITLMFPRTRAASNF